MHFIIFFNAQWKRRPLSLVCYSFHALLIGDKCGTVHQVVGFFLNVFSFYGPDAAASMVEKAIYDTSLVRPLLGVEGNLRRLMDRRCSYLFF